MQINGCFIILLRELQLTHRQFFGVRSSTSVLSRREMLWLVADVSFITFSSDEKERSYHSSHLISSDLISIDLISSELSGSSECCETTHFDIGAINEIRVF